LSTLLFRKKSIKKETFPLLIAIIKESSKMNLKKFKIISIGLKG
jgi:hypothetical protein